MSNQLSSEPNVGVVAKKRRFRFLTKKRLVLLLIIVIVAVGAGWFFVLRDSKSEYVITETDLEIEKVNLALVAGDNKSALEYAKKALELSPDDLYTLELTASLTKESDPQEAKRLYARALEVFKKNDNPDEEGKKAITYMAAAGLAENAGLTDQAKLYYQKVIASSDPYDELNRVIITDAEERLKNLQ